MRAGVIVFPGSNCDRDVIIALKTISNFKPKILWHKETEIPNLDLVVVPGGFSFGDYLRCGAIAAKSPIINSLKDHASRGGSVLGICNGFQILIETKLLPGTLITNKNLNFVCKDISLITQKTRPSPFTNGLTPGDKVNFPIAHNDGNYFCDDELTKKLHNEGQIAFKYLPNDNPNGSVDNIAGVLSENGRILGMMPHPERAIENFHSSQDGKLFFNGLIKHLLG